MGRKFKNREKTRLFVLSVFLAMLKGDEVICVNLICYFYILRQNPVSVLVNVLSGYQEKIKGFFHLGGLSFKSNIGNSKLHPFNSTPPDFSAATISND